VVGYLRMPANGLKAPMPYLSSRVRKPKHCCTVPVDPRGPKPDYTGDLGGKHGDVDFLVDRRGTVGLEETLGVGSTWMDLLTAGV